MPTRADQQLPGQSSLWGAGVPTLCEYGEAGPGATCPEPATFEAVCAWVRGEEPTVETGEAQKRCCLRHANYYAHAWAYGPCVLYPAMRDATWLTPIRLG